MSNKSTFATPALAAACLGFVVVSLDATVANVALEDLRLALAANLSMLEWVLNAYTVAFAGLLLQRWRCDRHGRCSAGVIWLARRYSSRRRSTAG
ncbi:hypothetical protein ACOJBO_04825 [Rhizobium beringeri]